MTAIAKWVGGYIIKYLLEYVIKYLKDEKIDKAKAKEIKAKVKDIMEEKDAQTRAKRISDLFNS